MDTLHNSLDKTNGIQLNEHDTQEHPHPASDYYHRVCSVYSVLRQTVLKFISADPAIQRVEYEKALNAAEIFLAEQDSGPFEVFPDAFREKLLSLDSRIPVFLKRIGSCRRRMHAALEKDAGEAALH